MKIWLNCSCGKLYRVGSAKAGTSIRCHACGNELAVPDPRKIAVGDEPPDTGAVLRWLETQYELGASREELIEQFSEITSAPSGAAYLVDDLIAAMEAREAASREPIVVRRRSNGGGMQWVVWLSILVGINLLSAIFDWGFWLY